MDLYAGLKQVAATVEELSERMGHTETRVVDLDDARREHQETIDALLTATENVLKRLDSLEKKLDLASRAANALAVKK